jgi:hypothetical protein
MKKNFVFRAFAFVKISGRDFSSFYFQENFGLVRKMSFRKMSDVRCQMLEIKLALSNI